MIALYYDPTIILLLPVILLTLYAQSKVKSTYRRYLRVATSKGYTGSEVARVMLNNNGLSHVDIEMAPGMLTDHYDPRNRVLRLSRDVYLGTAIASNAIAAHEVGHAIQHEEGYVPLKVRNAIVPLTQIASNLSWLFIMGGLIFSSLHHLLTIGIAMFSIAVFFQIITLPVEFDASRRAIEELEGEGFLEGRELAGGKQVLDAAALTYIAATASAMVQLIRLLFIRDRRRS
ncbi:MAG: zinc metallopeptidase [Filifactor alocis]|nr:zinc metallopeptidase [Filifactor alocis]